MPRLKTLQPRIKVLGMPVQELLKRRSSRTGRDADPRRTIPLNSSHWQRLRALILDDEPLCRHCWERGLTVPATDVDHISGDPSDNSRENLAGLCHSCHSIKTAADHGKRVNQGCGVDGLPASWKNHEQPTAPDRTPSLPLTLTAKADHEND